MKSFIVIGSFLLLSCFGVTHGGYSHSKEVAEKRCKSPFRYSASVNKCVCDTACPASPKIIQDPITCRCICKEVLACSDNKWWDSKTCECKCYKTPTIRTDLAFDPNYLACTAPTSFSNKTCNCECAAKHCEGNQIPQKEHNCECGCENHEVDEKECEKKGMLYSYNTVTCVCRNPTWDFIWGFLGPLAPLFTPFFN